MSARHHAILACFEPLSDPRRSGGNHRHRFLDIIAIAFLGTLCNCETWEDLEDFARERRAWLGQFLGLEKGIPSHDTIGRVIARLDPAAFFECLRNWIAALQLDLAGKGIQIDGKTARGSFDASSNLKALHLVSAWVDDLSLCLGQIATEAKSNEITAVPLLLELLEIKGAVVTLDALNCQQQTIETIIQREADYLIAVKDNQPKLATAIAEHFEQALGQEQRDRAVRSHVRKSRSRGRLSEQTVTVAPVPAAIRAEGKWHSAQSIGMVHRHRRAADPANPQGLPETDQVSWFISSLPPVASRASRYVRQHWAVENDLHWTLDVTFSEDHSRIRQGHAPAIMAGLRRFVLSLLKRDTSLPKTSLRRKRLRAALNPKTLERILSSV